MKKIAILMGSDSDLPIVEKGINVLKEYGVPFEVHVYSAHRTPVEAKAFAENINGKTVVIKAKGGANGKLFGSVTAKEIATLVSSQFSVKVDKRKITVDDIKTFGTYNTQVRLHPQVTADFKVQVVEE
mgnify:CR=1 FL=1